jgi:uncharacterized GH25 family protein
MKKTVLTIFAFSLLGSSAFAHHMDVYEDSGTNVKELSTHLPVTFY